MDDSNFDAAFGFEPTSLTAPDMYDGFPTSSDPNADTAATSAAAAFESEFGSFPTDFGSFPTTSVDVTDPFAAAFGDDSNTYQPPLFGAMGVSDGLASSFPPPPKMYDKSPIDDPPLNKAGTASTKIKFIPPRPKLHMTSKIPLPVVNPLSGHLILCQKSTSHTN